MCLVRVFIFVKKAEQMYEKAEQNVDQVRVMRWVSSDYAQRGEERWDESTERRGDNFVKKVN